MNEYVSMDFIKFLLSEVHDLESILKLERYADFDEESVNILIDSIKDFADQDFYPTYREMDADPARFENGKIYTHPKVVEVIKKSAELGLIGATFDNEVGGLQLPHLVYTTLAYIQAAANNNIGGYMGLTAGSANLIVTFGSQELKDRFVPKMLSGEWSGTMCLTEPEAGSSLSDISSSATPLEDGSYKIKGQKIYISGGDHEGASNFVHLYLARIDGAPSGTKGISLFVVPKYREENGEMVYNDVATAGDFQKMGQKGYCTTHLILGENDDCRGWLVGSPNMGLKYMFQMMNGARIDVGLTATAISSAAYYASLKYAKERAQGRLVNNHGQKNVNEDQTLIINHPDVRRMLLKQKAISEGSANLLFRCSRLLDVIHSGADQEEKERAHDMLEWLTPIAKTYPSQFGNDSVSAGVQVLGGAGFTSEYVLQQYYRDIRITAIYEGTTGIQSLDLLGRKIQLKNGQATQLIMAEIQKSIGEAMTFEDLKPYANKLISALNDVQEVLATLFGYAQKGDYQRYLMDATIFMYMVSHTVIAWQWLEMATIARRALVTGNGNFSEEFYESQIHTMMYFFKYELPKIKGHKETLLSADTVTMVQEKEFII